MALGLWSSCQQSVSPKRLGPSLPSSPMSKACEDSPWTIPKAAANSAPPMSNPGGLDPDGSRAVVCWKKVGVIDKEIRRQGDEETRRQGEKRQGDGEMGKEEMGGAVRDIEPVFLHATVCE